MFGDESQVPTNAGGQKCMENSSIDFSQYPKHMSFNIVGDDNILDEASELVSLKSNDLRGNNNHKRKNAYIQGPAECYNEIVAEQTNQENIGEFLEGSREIHTIQYEYEEEKKNDTNDVDTHFGVTATINKKNSGNTSFSSDQAIIDQDQNLVSLDFESMNNFDSIVQNDTFQVNWRINKHQNI